MKMALAESADTILLTHPGWKPRAAACPESTTTTDTTTATTTVEGAGNDDDDDDGNQTPSAVYAVSLRLLRRFPESVLMRMFPEGIPPSAVLSLAELDAVMSMLLIRPRLLQWAQNLLSARGRDAHEGDADESAAKTTHYYSCSDHAGHDGHANPQQKSAHHEGQAPCAIADVSCVDTSLGDMDGPSFASVHMDAIPLAVNTAATTDTISTVHTAHIPPYGPNISIGSLSSDPSSFYSESTDASDDYTETLKHNTTTTTTTTTPIPTAPPTQMLRAMTMQTTGLQTIQFGICLIRSWSISIWRTFLDVVFLIPR
ncbi:hypothetical protein BASA62_008375 [Batrachochytrium salamandrivorans]|nr:hypothetical protein BASA62_008375 [Batrachochytrium salamandrivorans]